ncbi:MAG TPA: hypothetical protein VGN90_15515, partial [Pyrinomonadaceae bacterium]|nr:hypothetical protein [Pyrinomonadaceae bacterium]
MLSPNRHALLRSYPRLIILVIFSALLLTGFLLLDRFAIPELAAPDATTFFVTNTNDSGPGSLRQA